MGLDNLSEHFGCRTCIARENLLVPMYAVEEKRFLEGGLLQRPRSQILGSRTRSVQACDRPNA